MCGGNIAAGQSDLDVSVEDTRPLPIGLKASERKRRMDASAAARSP
jgi:hypothetical protein